MATPPQELRLGCVVTVPASRFDDGSTERWSVAEFGHEADSKVLDCTVVAMRAGTVKVRVHHDGDRYHLDRAAVSHKPAACPNRRHVASPQVRAPRQPRVGGRCAVSTTLGPSAAGRQSGHGDNGTGTGDNGPRDDISDDEAPLHSLALAAAHVFKQEARCSREPLGGPPPRPALQTGPTRVQRPARRATERRIAELDVSFEEEAQQRAKGNGSNNRRGSNGRGASALPPADDESNKEEDSHKRRKQKLVFLTPTTVERKTGRGMQGSGVHGSGLQGSKQKGSGLLVGRTRRTPCKVAPVQLTQSCWCFSTPTNNGISENCSNMSNINEGATTCGSNNNRLEQLPVRGCEKQVGATGWSRCRREKQRVGNRWEQEVGAAQTGWSSCRWEQQ